MEVYFPDVPNLGDFCLEHVFYEYEEPVLFVCIDQRENRYLCSCSRLSEQWLVGRITNEQLLEIIDKSLAVDSFFRTCGFTFCVHWDGENLRYTSDLPADAFPRTNSFLRLSSEQTREYRRMVQASCRTASSRRFVSAAAYGRENDIEYVKSLAKCLSAASTEVREQRSKYIARASANTARLESDLVKNTDLLHAA